MDEKRDKKKRITFLITFSVSAALFLITVLFVLWAILLGDKNRSNHVRSETEYSEIIKKNYIKGFESTSKDGSFSFRLREDEMNDLLFDGVKEINDRHIENIYYEKGDDNTHIFYADLTKTIVKTRAVISTSVVEDDNVSANSIYLKINSVKIGKINATNLLTHKGYLTEEFLNKYFEASHLPISYDHTYRLFVISPTKYIDLFPKGELSSLFWQKVQNSVRVDPKTLGISVDFSKLRYNLDTSKISYNSYTSDYYEEVKAAANSLNIGSMDIGDSAVIYEISEKDFSTLLKRNLPNNTKEEVCSTILTSKVTFDLVDVYSSFVNGQEINVTFVYSINDYLIDVDLKLDFFDDSTAYFDFSFIVEYQVSLGGDNFEGFENKYVSHFAGILSKTLTNVSTSNSNCFAYSSSQDALYVSLEEMNNELANSTTRDSEKEVFIDTEVKTISFKITKTVS